MSERIIPVDYETGWSQWVDPAESNDLPRGICARRRTTARGRGNSARGSARGASRRGESLALGQLVMPRPDTRRTVDKQWFLGAVRDRLRALDHSGVGIKLERKSRPSRLVLVLTNIERPGISSVNIGIVLKHYIVGDGLPSSRRKELRFVIKTGLNIA